MKPQVWILRILIISSIASSCSTKMDQKVSYSDTPVDSASSQYTGDFELDDYLATGDIGNINVENIEFDCAILIYPTPEQIEKMKKQKGETNFYRIADDNLWYQAMAIENIDSLGIETITVSERYLRLKAVNETWELDIRQKNLPAWNVMLFNRAKAPIVVSPANLTVDNVKEYFDIR